MVRFEGIREEKKTAKKAENGGLKRGVKLKKRPRRPMDSQGMRYYPAFGVKSGPDALFRRFLGAGSRCRRGFEAPPASVSHHGLINKKAMGQRSLPMP
jgi:hypothetical protein